MTLASSKPMRWLFSICFDEARLTDRATNYWDHLRREAREIKQPNNFNRDSWLHISKAWGPAISALRRLRARSQHSTSAPALAMPVVNHSIRTWGAPTLIRQQLENSAINRRATSDKEEEYNLYKQTIFPTAHIGHITSSTSSTRWPISPRTTGDSGQSRPP